MNTDRIDKPPEATAATTGTATTKPVTICPPPHEPKPPFDINLVLANFDDEFTTDALLAAERLHDLLIDPLSCDARCIHIAKVRELAQQSENHPVRLQPVGSLSGANECVRELMWLANNELAAAIESGQASTTFLSQIASRPELLWLASRAAVDGKEAIADIVKVHQLEAWNWLRDEVVNGGLEKHLGDHVVGKHVAVWKKEQPYGEIVIGDSPQAVRTEARKRWRVPNALVAETFVDAN